MKIKKVVCKKDYLQYYHGDLIAFYKNRVYEVIKQALGIEQGGYGLYFVIKGERDINNQFDEKSFHLHFMDMAEFRDSRIDEILND